MAFQGDSIFWVEVEKIVPNPFQPRREFDEQKLRELSESVRMYGILQPLTVTRKEIQKEDGTFYTEYELIAGERRLRASKLAGLSQVPVIIREGEDSEQEKLELAIIENLQREDLNAVDRALAFRQLADVFGLSHTQVAKKVGRSREYVSNSIRLLALPDYMLSALRQAEMTEGHARTLLMLNDRPEEQDVVFREILMKKLSVREVERIVRKIATDKVRKKNPGEFDAELIEIEKKFMETLGTRVQIQKTDYGGRLTIDYFSVDDLEGMLTRMKVEQAVAPAAVAMATLTTHTPLEVAEDDTGREAADVTDEEVLSEVVSETLAGVSEPDPAPRPMSTFAPTFVAEPVGNHSAMPTPEPVPVPRETVPQAYTPAPVPAAPLPHDVQPYAAPAVPNPYLVERDVMVQPRVEPTAPVPEAVSPAPAPQPKDDDESGLYSIRNFGV
jgi:ParB family chromosome partitioning protein